MSLDDWCAHDAVIALYVRGIECNMECLLCKKNYVFLPEDYTKRENMYVGKWNHQGKNQLKTYDLYVKARPPRGKK